MVTALVNPNISSINSFPFYATQQDFTLDSFTLH
jgi:hypothetical protein